MQVESVDLNTNWCLIQFNPYNGKIKGIHKAGESVESMIDEYKKDWKTKYPLVMAKVQMKEEELFKIIADKEKTGGKYFVKTSFFKSENEPENYEDIFSGTTDILCDYTAQFYRNGVLWPVVDWITVRRDDVIAILIKSEQALAGDFTYHFRAKSEEGQDIEIADGIAGSLADGELIKQIDLSQINFSYYQDIELKIEHPDSGNSYLYFKVI